MNWYTQRARHGEHATTLSCMSDLTPLPLQERCVDMAMELFELKTRFDEQEKELKWFKREADSRERDFKV